MAVDQENIVDFVSRAPNGDCELAISDHLEWDEGNQHLHILQNKINRYLAFVESGELVDKYPEFAGVSVSIKTYFFHQPSADALRFLELARGAVVGAGLGFEWKCLPQLLER